MVLRTVPGIVVLCEHQGTQRSDSVLKMLFSFGGTGLYGRIFLKNFNVHLLFLRDRVRMGEGQRERETQNLKQAPGSELRAQSLTRGSNPRTMKS